MSRLEELRTRWSRHPSTRAFLPLAEEYRRLGRLREAVRTCREGLQRHPNDHSARVLLGRTLLEQDQPEEAAQEFRMVLGAEPQNLLAGRLLAGIYRNQGQWAEALETLRKLQVYYPDDTDVRSQIYQLERFPEGATEETGPTPLEIITPREDVLATNTLAEIYLRQGLVDRALGVYESMLRADPDNEAARRRIREIQGAPSEDAGSPRSPEPVGEEILEPAIPATDPRLRVIQGLQSWLIGIRKG